MSDNKVNKLDFDFNRMSGKKKKINNNDSPEKRIILTYPVKNGYISEDIASISIDRFLAWADFFYPIKILIPREKLEILSVKMSIFKEILQYHTYSLFQSNPLSKRNILN